MTFVGETMGLPNIEKIDCPEIAIFIVKLKYDIIVFSGDNLGDFDYLYCIENNNLSSKAKINL